MKLLGKYLQLNRIDDLFLIGLMCNYCRINDEVNL